ncbi:MAG: mechanosensitive ion channel family protein [Bdellovibrionales bacterium]|nr:mechanosensitive ion channel family protein [Bdellovibrionales bacterium]
MNPKNPPLIPLARIESLLSPEPVFVLAGLALVAWLIYKIFLRAASAERHRNLKRHFLNMLAHLTVFGVLYLGYSVSLRAADLGNGPSDVLTSYLGLATLVSGAIVFVKISRIILFEYLFLGHMREGVPLLIVNLFALLLSVGIAGWFATEIFGIKLGPVLATSAVFSLILGLALQDTLGNLFAGVALQLDKPYEIGDWIEVSQGGQTWVGQVEEISWRATTLIGLFDEFLILPNRLMSGSEISNFTARGAPIWRSQAFRIPYAADLNTTKEIIARAVAQVDGVRTNPSPIVWIRETTESWLVFRCSYTIDDYSHQFRVGSNVITAVVEALKQSGFAAAANRIQLVAEPGQPGHTREIRL